MMIKPEFLDRIADNALPTGERLTLLAQFVLMNGLDGPHELLGERSLPKGYVFRLRILRDIVLCLAISQKEAADNPKNATVESAQVWQLALTDAGGINRQQSAVLYTMNGALTSVRQIDNPARSDALLLEWTQEPPTEVELAPAAAPHTLQ